MKFPFFASFIVFCLWLSHQLKKRRKIESQSEKDFWEAEAAANNTRRKSLEELPYITIPYDTLPLDRLPENEKVQDYCQTLLALKDQKIVNFTGYTNTELKLQYGAPNINLLMTYDQCYTTLVSTLQRLAQEFFQAGLYNDAQTILEFAVSAGTDVSRSYYLLADLYKMNQEASRISELIQAVQQTKAPLMSSIVETLEQKLQE